MVEEKLKGTIMLLPKFPLSRQMNLEKQKENPEPENAHVPVKRGEID